MQSCAPVLEGRERHGSDRAKRRSWKSCVMGVRILSALAAASLTVSTCTHPAPQGVSSFKADGGPQNVDRPVESSGPLPEAARAAHLLVDFLSHTKSTDEFTAEVIGKHFGATLSPAKTRSIYRSPDMGAGWIYGIAAEPPSKFLKSGFSFWFYNPNRQADTKRICVLELGTLIAKLEANGFTVDAVPFEFGGTRSIDFTKDDVVVTVTRHDVVSGPTGDQCVTRLQTTDGR